MREPGEFGAIEDDSAAIARCRQGDVEGLASLIRRHEASALRLAWLLTGDRALAEDITQDSFIQAWRALPRFDASRPFLPWLQGIVTNTARMRLRAARRRREVSLTALAGDEEEAARKEARDGPLAAEPGERRGVNGANGANPAARAEWLEQRAAIGQALAALTEKQREAVALRYYLDYSDQEIATILGCAIGTARRRIYDGLRALDHIIRQRFPWLLRDQNTPTPRAPADPDDPIDPTTPPSAHQEGARAR